MRKHTRSRSRSRSRSPHGQGRNPPREYQNNRGFRGFHRGFRRPYYFRGRGRGFFPRGRYQRGSGGGGYNNNYRPNGWQNYRQHPQQNQNQHQQYYPHSPRRGRSRSPKKRSGSPRSHSHSDRSSSPRSRHRSPSSSSSSSRSSSPRRKSAGGAGRLNARDVREEEREASKEGQKGGGGGGGEEAAPLTGGAGGAEEAEEGASANGNAKANKAVGRWQGLTDYSTSPRREGSLFPAATPGQAPPAQAPPAQAPPAQAPQASPPPHSSGDAGNGGPSSRSPLFSGFGFFSKEDSLADKEAISSAFKKFLEEHNNKKKLQSALENGREKGPNGVEAEPGKGTGKPPEASVPRALRAAGEAQRERRYEREASETSEAGVYLSSFLKDSPFLCEDEEREEREERAPKPRPKQPRQDARPNEDAGPRGRATRSARQLFEERFGQWEELAYAPAARDDDLEAEGHTGRKQEAAIAAVLAQRKQAAMFSGCPSPEKGSRARRKERAVSSPSPSPSPPPRRNSDREKFLLRGDSPPRASGKKGEFCVRMDGLREGIASSSKAVLGERRACRDLGLLSEQEGFCTSLRHAHRSPAELYAQHIVTIVHRIRAQHFSSSEMTLNERFAMYQRRAEEKEMDKPRKSPEIHRRIDVSPSAFKKQSHLSERMRNSEDGSYKNHGRATRSDSNDLRLDIERRKKHPTQEQDCKRGGRGRREEGDSPDSGREQLAEKSSRHRKKSKKCKKKHSRSSSSSSSDSEGEAGVVFPQEEAPPREEGFNRARLGPRDAGGPVERGQPRGGFQLRIRGRGWNRGNYQGNHQGNHQGNGGVPSNVPPHANNEDWDPEFTPKSRKYYLTTALLISPPQHDDRDEEGNRRWFDNRGRGRGYFPRARGRFLVRKGPPGTSSNGSPRWSHDKFLGTREVGQEEGGQDHKEGGQEGVMDTSEQ
ncbi:thyroid hormone receptor-associated protein 3 isoform X4 [Osmerus eperlanus]|uniref:thyroid hormone receptor-associated protein 3 isoform X4 n=1 Tax=Osmerus eperlanus TaxID=29151 RepID=UPI002E0FBDC3